MGKVIDWNEWDTRTKRFSAHVIMDGDKVVAKIVLLYPSDGAGRLTAMVHTMGRKPVKGFASGYGYDKASAAVADAVQADAMQGRGADDPMSDNLVDCWNEVMKDSGENWYDIPRKHGLTHVQAV